MVNSARQLLKQHFGYESFLEGQEILVTEILSGRDVLGIMPTGSGKSLCFQVPAMGLPGITLVISPLISLMHDQVMDLVAAGIPAAYINSSLNPAQTARALDNAARGMYRIIYVAPERLETPGFQRMIRQVTVSQVAVDEAHCVSQWGHDFRPGYLGIRDFIAGLPVRPVVSAFTATATPPVRRDVLEMLSLRDPRVVITGLNRPNLYLQVDHPADKDLAVLEYLRRNPGKGGIVYCSTRKTVDALCGRLKREDILAVGYHAGLPEQDRTLGQEEFLSGRARVMVATNAFGMGIDKPDVDFVIHYNMPGNLENYYQEAGRAGRDGRPADCILLYGPQDPSTHSYMLECAAREQGGQGEEIRERDRMRLKQMVWYCHTRECLRDYILSYFGEEPSGGCGHCSSCRRGYREQDITGPARTILSLVRDGGQRFGPATLIQALRGSRSARTLRTGLAAAEGYGKLRTLGEQELRDILYHMEMEDFVEITTGQYPAVLLTLRGRRVLSGQEEVCMLGEDGVSSPEDPPGEDREDLLATLRELRSGLARDRKVPAYVIFPDATLKAMARRMPRTLAELSGIPGVGKVKLECFGKDFLDAVRMYRESGDEKDSL